MNRLAKEVEFGEMFEEYGLSTPQQDLIEHWDVAVEDRFFEKFMLGQSQMIPRLDGNGWAVALPYRVVHSGDPILFDVKAQPKGEQSDRFRWVELRNVHGEKGSMYGKSDFVAFEHAEYYWIFVPTKKLAAMVENRLQGTVTSVDWVNQPQPYYTHTRDQRNDLITQVPIMDLCWIGTIVQKPKR